MQNIKELLENNGVKVYDSTDSLFESGGTVNEDYIKVSGKKIPISEVKIYNRYNYEGVILASIPYVIKDNTITILNGNNKTRKIKEDNEYAWKFTKTLVKAVDGTEGLIRNINKYNSPGSPLNGVLFNAFAEA